MRIRRVSFVIGLALATIYASVGCRTGNYHWRAFRGRDPDACNIEFVRDYVRAMDSLSSCEVYARFAFALATKDTVYRNVVLPVPDSGVRLVTRWGVHQDARLEEGWIQSILECYYTRIGSHFSSVSIMAESRYYPDRNVIVVMWDDDDIQLFLEKLRVYLGCSDESLRRDYPVLDSLRTQK